MRRLVPFAFVLCASARVSAAPPGAQEGERRGASGLGSTAEPASAGVDEGPERLVWEPGWRRFGWTNVAVIGAGLGAIGAAFLVGPDRDSPRTGDWLIDEDFRNWVRPDDAGTRQTFRHLSDVLLGLNLVNAYVGDALINAAWYRDSPDVAWQLAAIDTQVLVVATAVQLWTANIVSRERPYGRLCGTDELSAQDSDCTGDYRYRSFYSGHTSFSFALAAATCTHHAHLPLHGGRGRWVPCAASLTVAAATGSMRILGDQHYLSDVVAGAAVGGAIGWFIPWLHYATGEPPTAVLGDDVRIAVVPFGRGAAVVGTLP